MKTQAFHGSKSHFSTFETGHSGRSKNEHSDVLFFSDSRYNASGYATSKNGGYLYNVDLSMKNPMIVDAQGRSFLRIIEGAEFRQGLGWVVNNPNFEVGGDEPYFLPAPSELCQDPKGINELIEIAKNSGHDGLIVKNVTDCGHFSFDKVEQTTFAVFDANNVQILSTEKI